MERTINQRAVDGARYAVGLGFIAGGIEAVVVASRETLLLGWLGFALVGLVAVLVMGAVSGVVGALLALPLHFVLRNTRFSTALAVHTALVGFLLIGFYLWQVAWLVYTDERAPGAIAMAAMPLGFAGVIYYNARFLLRRIEAGKPLGWPWGRTAFASALGFVALSATLFSFRDTGGTHALQDDQNLLVLSIDGWPEPMPALAGATVFDNAVTPSASNRPSAAGLQTGIHPLRTKVLFEDDALAWNYRTLAEVLSVEGYATAAFVGDPALGVESGLGQGFKVYDADTSPWIPGLLRFNVPQWLLGSLRRPRTDTAVVASFEAWLDQKRDLPFYAWVHVGAGPEVARVLDAIEPLQDETLVVVVGLGGDPTRGVYDDAVRIPLLVRVPGVERRVERVTVQVRSLDVVATAMRFLGMEGHETEGLDLAGYVTGERKATLGCTLVGHDSTGPLLGVRNNGMKFIERTGGVTELYDLDADPSEQRDLSTKHPSSLESAQRLLAPDSMRFENLLKAR